MACFPMPTPRLSGGAVRLGTESVGRDPASGDQADGAVLTGSGSCRPCHGPGQRAPRSCFKPLAHQLALGAPTRARQRPGWPCHQFPARHLQPPSFENCAGKGK
ncbi:unnamed protein product [Rangifer tarandus platyrhynchus]|uniref:Uncharacterized protein n=1 Tax=Rangifer tarandus platyrhynchus TaxID=3082113 RepID=A0ACB1MJV1_RANTA